MTYRPPRIALFCSLSLFLVVSAGCLGLAGQQQLPDGETVSDSLRSVDAVEATATMEIDLGNETTAFTMDFVERTGTGEFRANMHQNSSDARMLLVSNGTVTWIHNRTTDEVTRLRLHNQSAQWNQSVESIGAMFDSLKESTTDEDVSISPLPAVPGGGGSAVGTAGIASMPAAGNVSMTYQGTGTAADREAHVIDIGAATNESLIDNGTIWFDAERYYPIKSTYDMTVGGQAASVTLTYDDITYNPEVADDAFTYDPPANATIRDNQSIVTAQTRAGLVGEAEQSVPDPDLPAGYQFAQGSMTSVDGEETLSLQYANRTDTIVISKRTGTDTPVEDRGESIDVAGHEGTYETLGDRSSVSWQCEDNGYSVIGPLSKPELANIAESIACE